jgi:ATP-dependent HslUV protease subunit HslV
MHKDPNKIYGTTILAVRKGNEISIAGDGQISLGGTIMKATAKKIRELNNGNVLTGFAGSTADAMTLYERLEKKLEQYNNQLMRASVELAKDWRTDKYLRRLEAMMIVADKKNILIISGTGDVIEPEDNIAAIGSGSNFAKAAAKALIDIKDISAEEIVVKAMNIAADICVYSNHNIIVKTLKV